MRCPADYSETKIIRIVNAELADTLGNLLSRCTGNALNPKQTFPKNAENHFTNNDVTLNLLESVEALPDICREHYGAFNFYKVADCVMATLHKANLFFETLKPWELKKQRETEKLDTVLHLTLETLRVCGILLQPMIPNISRKLLDRINVAQDERTFESTKKLSWINSDFKERKLGAGPLVLFKRIESVEKIKKSGVQNK